MHLFDLSEDLIILVLEELDPISLFQFCRTSNRVRFLVHSFTFLRYRYELASNGMKDGPPGCFPVHLRLQQLLAFKHSWPKLSWTHQDSIRIFTPAVIGVTGGIFYHASQSAFVPLNHPIPWDLEIYELRSFRVAHMGRALRHIKLFIPFDIQRVVVDPTQNLLVLAEIFLEPMNFAIVVRLHIRQIWTDTHHPDGPPYIDVLTDWLGTPHEENNLYVRQLEICGDKVGVTIRYEEGNDATNNIVIVDWKRNTIQRCNDFHVFSFQFISPSYALFASRLDDGDSASSIDEYESDGEGSSRKAIVEYMTSNHEERSEQTPAPVLVLYNITSFKRVRVYELHPLWGGANVISVSIHPNVSLPANSDTVIPSGTLFYTAPETRRLMISVNFDPENVPPGFGAQAMIVVPELFFLFALPTDDYPDISIPWDDWFYRTECVLRHVGDLDHSFRVVGSKLLFLKGVSNPPKPLENTVEQQNRIVLTEFNRCVAAFVRPDSNGTVSTEKWTTITTLPEPGTYLRTSTVDGYNISLFGATQDNILLIDENDGTTVVSIYTFGEAPSGTNLLGWDAPNHR